MYVVSEVNVVLNWFEEPKGARSRQWISSPGFIGCCGLRGGIPVLKVSEASRRFMLSFSWVLYGQVLAALWIGLAPSLNGQQPGSQTQQPFVGGKWSGIVPREPHSLLSTGEEKFAQQD